ncbi:MAG TPA: SDR family NAD(P)-dependent oxidoreductase, partial [Allocoleopsis sp.]
NTSFFDVNIDTLKKALETNFFATFQVCQNLVPLMKINNYGRVVNVSSGMGQLSEMEAGFHGYRVSKTALNVLTKTLGDELKDTNILINSMCPGWVKTDMGGPNAPRTVEQGADTITWLATLPDSGPTGGFFRDRQLINW